MSSTGLRFRKPVGEISDRAKRYRANSMMGPPPRRCHWCKTTRARQYVWDHKDGDESNFDRRNLVSACKSCNTKRGKAMAAAGIGVRTRQYNPRNPRVELYQLKTSSGRRIRKATKVVFEDGRTVHFTERMPKLKAIKQARAVISKNPGATNLAQYVQAGVEHVRGAHDAAGRVIHETPKAKREEFAKEIWWRRGYRNPGDDPLMKRALAQLYPHKTFKALTSGELSRVGELAATLKSGAPAYLKEAATQLYGAGSFDKLNAHQFAEVKKLAEQMKHGKRNPRNSIASVILEQLGGSRFRVMTGAKNFVSSGNSLRFKLPSNFARHGVNLVKITLDASDTYTLEFFKMRGTKVEPIASQSDVYAEDLRDVFKRETGLNTSLGSMGNPSRPFIGPDGKVMHSGKRGSIPYRGFKIKRSGPKFWKVVYPDGRTAGMRVVSEEAAYALIDSIAEERVMTPAEHALVHPRRNSMEWGNVGAKQKSLRRIIAKATRAAQQAAKRMDLKSWDRHMRTIQKLEKEAQSKNPPADIMPEFRSGRLRSSSGRRVRKTVQAKAILLSELRRAGRIGPRRNPDLEDNDDKAAADAAYEEFHGAPSERTKVREVALIDPYNEHPNLWQLGKLISLTVGEFIERWKGRVGDKPESEHPDAWSEHIEFDINSAPDVAGEPGGTQLFIIGGNQNIDRYLGKLRSDPGKDPADLGFVYRIEYLTRKDFHKFAPVDYWHHFGEETGTQPRLIYDKTNHRLQLAGGEYVVKREGIVN
jgi:hypothetical protein